MANELFSLDLNFLTDAAHLLAATAPETAAHLMSQRNSLMFHNQLELTDAQRQHVCGSCGHIMLPGKDKEGFIRLEQDKILCGIRRRRPGHPQQKSSSSSSSSAGTRACKHLTCGMCGRYTRIALPPAPRISRVRPTNKGRGTVAATAVAAATRVPAPSAQTNTTAMQTATEPPRVSANASSKKRAKNRKQGLQALLQQSQATSSKGGGLGGLRLSLTDFMKK
jgi:RNase P subunit RPR2